MVYCSRGFHSIVIWLHCSVGCNEENLMVRRVWLGKVTSEGLGNREMDSRVWPLVIQTSAIRPHNEKFWYLSTGQRLRSHPVHWLGGWGFHIQTQHEVRGWSNGPRVNSGTESRSDSQFYCLQASCLQASPSPSVTRKPEMSIVSANGWGH